jgi:hypothetical protein
MRYAAQMHRRIGWLLVALLGCGDDGGAGTGGSTSAGDGGPTSAGPTTEAPTTSSDDGSGSGGLLTTGGPTDDTGPPPGGECRDASDCVLDDDCCHCAAYGGALPDGHACAVPSCDQSTCSAVGHPDATAECFEGACVLSKVDCDPSTVVCDAIPPDCAAGRAPEIVDGCYTQACIAIDACSQVAYFSCDECSAGEVCVRFSECAGDACTPVQACLPDPGAAVLNCATAASLCAYFSPAYACYDGAAGPFCCAGDADVCASAG